MQIMESSGVGDAELEDRVSIRQMRQGILSKRNPVELCTFIDETVFARPVGGPRVMADQLQQVVSVGNTENVTVRVLPRSLGAHAGLSGAFVLYEFVKSRPVVYLEARRSGAFIDAPEDVSLFLDAVKLLEMRASDPAVSREILNEYVQQYESEA
ncbi:DUF5753 domain-containing protein [Saccharopolyspora sp. K220]|uniref:DUF5753 domain-containing protein n=1 Tax=Saccharopolyspora soli TaxID=2926618 RepID=UPI001F5A0AE8|nr:DUF5753 domain-containing protein [Saccharopolyspora soli]MCI2416134.1 DUF5753 domain-containing protein [Saccharopolyspora soli]